MGNLINNNFNIKNKYLSKEYTIIENNFIDSDNLLSFIIDIDGKKYIVKKIRTKNIGISEIEKYEGNLICFW